MSIDPELLFMNPDNKLTSVVLPAPLCPNNAKI